MSGPPTSALTIPEPLDEDDDDIRWALQTAAVQWRRGAREDAIAWLRRGADSAVDGGLWERASQLNVIASQLERSLSGVDESDVPAPPSAPKFPPRAPSPASHSVAPHSTRSGLPTAPISVRAPTSTLPAPNSKWPTGFPTSAPATLLTPSGRAIAPPPPLPASVRVPKAPIPPRPKPVAVRESNRLSVEIHGVEELDMSEAELIELQEDVTVRAQIAPNAPESVRPEPRSAAPPFKVFPRFEPDEDPMDGTTTLPLPSVYPESFLPDSLDGQSLPAFPLEDSVPAGPPSAAHPAQIAPRSSPLPQISVARISSGLPGPMPSLISSQTSSGPQKFSRPSTRVEHKGSVPPPVPVSRTVPPGFDPVASERPSPSSRKPQSLPPVAPSESTFLSNPPFPYLDSDIPPPFPDAEEASLPTISMDDL